MTEYSIPKRTTGERILEIIQAYYGVGAHTESVSSAKVDEMLGVSDITGRQTSFLDAINIVEKDGRKRRLTSEGEDIAEALMVDRDGDLAKERLRNLLQEWKFVSEIESFVEMRDEGVTEEQIVDYIQSNAATQDDRGMSSIIDLLEWSEILTKGESDGNYTTVTNPVMETEDTESINPDQPNRDDSSTTDENRVNASGKAQQNEEDKITDRIEVSFEFSAEDDPSEIEGAISAARRALEKDIE